MSDDDATTTSHADEAPTVEQSAVVVPVTPVTAVRRERWLHRQSMLVGAASVLLLGAVFALGVIVGGHGDDHGRGDGERSWQDGGFGDHRGGFNGPRGGMGRGGMGGGGMGRRGMDRGGMGTGQFDQAPADGTANPSNSTPPTAGNAVPGGKAATKPPA